MNRDSTQNQIVVVRLEVREPGHVAFLAVNNPEKRNALGIAGKKALTEAFRQLARDNALRVAVLTGAGDRSFISGADIAEMKDLTRKEAHEEVTTDD